MKGFRAAAALVALAAACTVPKESIPRVPSERVVAVAKENGGTYDLPIANHWAMESLQGVGVDPPPRLRILSVESDPRPAGSRAPRDVRVRLAVENFEVSERSGQHVLVWLDADLRGILSDLSRPLVLEDVPPGRHAVTAVLVRSYRIHLKNPEATASAAFTAGEVPTHEGLASDDPLLLYAYPRGTYLQRDGSSQNILLDFHLRNAVLGPLTYRVRYWVDGVYRGDILAHKPEVILENPAPGEHTVRLELLDRFNRTVHAPGNPAVHTFRVE